MMAAPNLYLYPDRADLIIGKVDATAAQNL
jgi:hypothetical protein